jgi:formylglycine-generating enzyme required for sulfatase activity
MGNHPSLFKNNPNHPMESVSWDDVQIFLRKLNEQEGKDDYCLPTEAQWEYACRAGTETPRYHPEINTIAWYLGNSNDQTQPVGQKLPNAWKLYDMLGNVWEWCQDGARTYTADTTVDPTRPTNADALHVVRGGSWYGLRTRHTGSLPPCGPLQPPQRLPWLPLCMLRKSEVAERSQSKLSRTTRKSCHYPIIKAEGTAGQ